FEDSPDNQVAVISGCLRDQQVHAGNHVPSVFVTAINSDVQTDGGRDAGVQRQHELFDVLPLTVVLESEDRVVQKTEKRIGRSIVNESKAGDLLARGIHHSQFLI